MTQTAKEFHCNLAQRRQLGETLRDSTIRAEVQRHRQNVSLQLSVRLQKHYSQPSLPHRAESISTAPAGASRTQPQSPQLTDRPHPDRNVTHWIRAASRFCMDETIWTHGCFSEIHLKVIDANYSIEHL